VPLCVLQLLEKCQVKIQGDFVQWFEQLHTNRGASLVQRAVQETQSSVQSLLNSSSSTANGSFQQSINPALSFASDNTSGYNRGREDKAYRAEAKSSTNSSNIAPAKFDDEDVNEDIMAFYQAKEELLKRRSQS
jgi:hypothetical protein